SSPAVRDLDGPTGPSGSLQAGRTRLNVHRGGKQKNSPPRLGGADASGCFIRERRGGRSTMRSHLIDAREALVLNRSTSWISIRWLRIFFNHPVCAQIW